MYLVTGASGNVGSEVASQLLASGRKVRVFTREASKVTHLRDRVEVATGDFQDMDSFTRAMAGVEGVFLMNQTQDAEGVGRLAAAAKAVDSPQIVFLSSLAANDPKLQIGRLHKQREDAIRESGLQAKFVRPSGFMSNSYQWIRTIKSEGVVYNPMGDTKFPAIAPEDVAAVAVKALMDSGITGDVFELTGGELLNVPDQVKLLSDALGRPVRTVDIPVEKAIENFVRAGIPAHIAAAVGESFASVRDGRAIAVTDTVQKVTGRAPMTFASWIQKHASRFA